MHEVASKLVEIQTQLIFFHWQTKSYLKTSGVWNGL